MNRRVAALAAAGLLLTACGGDDEAGRFDEQVDRIRAAVEAGDRDAALAELDAVSFLAAEAQAEGDLADAEVQELTRLVAQGRALVDQQLPEPTTTTTTTTTTTAPPAPAPVEHEDDDDEDGKKGKGKGSEGDDD